jgi:hypothetical protein
MVIAEKAPQGFWRAGVMLFALQAHIYLFGTPYFQAGLWFTQEPRAVALFLVAALTCGWFWQGIRRQWLSVPSPFPLYFKLIFAWTGWQILVTLLSATSGWRSWFGSGMYGEGAGWYIAITLTTILAYALWPHMRYRMAMVYAVVSALIGMYALQVVPDTNSAWQTFAWPDYLAFLIGWTWMIVLLAKPKMSMHSQLGIALLACALVIGTANRSAWLLYPAGAFVLLAVMWIAERRADKSLPGVPRWMRHAAVLGCLLPILYTVASYNPDTGTGTSLEQRIHLNAIGLTAILDEPSRLLMGKGWNAFQDDNLKYAVFDSVAMFSDGEFKPNATNIFGTAAHSHNQPLEALLALGIIGFFLWYALMLVVIRRIPAAMFWRIIPIHGAMVLLFYFWFPLSFFLSFIALYWAGLAHTLEHGEKKTTAPLPTKSDRMLSPLVALAFIPLAYVMLWSSWESYRAMRYGDWILHVLYTPYQPYQMEAILEDGERGGERLRTIVGEFLDNVHADRRGVEPDSYLWIERLLQASFLLGQKPNIGAHVATLDIAIQFFLQMRPSDERLTRARADSFLFYPASVMRLTQVAPRREDLTMPYLYDLDKMKNTGDMSLMLNRIRDVQPNHRIATWLTGTMLLDNPKTKASGERLMHEALEAGVDTIYPIPRAERWRIERETITPLAP